jgi:V8-like Glu-specific endopeptidase
MAGEAPNSPLNVQIRIIRELIAAGELGEALDRLHGLALNGPPDLLNEAIVLRGRFAQLSREERRGRISRDDSLRERRAIEFSAQELLLELGRKLPKSVGPVPTPPAAEQFTVTEAAAFEKIIGVNNLKQIAWIEQGVCVSRAVCRILTANGLGSGFLIAPGIVMTNNHVIASLAQAKDASTKIEFNYQLPFASAQRAGTVRYDLDPDKFFHTSAAGELDYTVVAVKAESIASKPTIESWGSLKLNPNSDPVRNDHVSIVQHPNGQPKQIAMTGNAVLQIKSPFLHYSTDTMRGSSGSPVFNDLWEVIAIHHAAGPDVKASDGGVRQSNEAILMSSIIPHLGDRWPLNGAK